MTTTNYAICTGWKERVYAVIEAPDRMTAVKWTFEDYPELRSVSMVTVREATKKDVV